MAGFDAYHTWLGISKADQPPNHYRLLAIDLFEVDADVISNAADRQMAHLRTYQAGKHSSLSQKLLNEVAAARVTLLNPQKKAAYDDGLRQRLAVPDTGAREESSSNVRLQAELAEIAEASHHLPARQRPSGTSLWSWAAVALIMAPMACGILWFASRRSAEVAKRPPEMAQVVKTSPVPASPRPQSEKQPAKKMVVSTPLKTVEGKAPEKQPSATDPAPESPTPVAPQAPAPAAVATAPVTPMVAEPPAAKPQAVSLLPPTPSHQPESPKQPELPAPTRQKLPVPDDAAVEQARKAADALFKTEIEKAKTSADKVALAKRVLAQAAEQNGAADKYVLMVMARELGGAARDADATFQAVDQTAEAFEVDRFGLKTEILSAWAKEARTPDARKWVVEQMLLVGEEAIDAGELDAAKELNKLAGSRGSGIREIAQKMKVYRQQLSEAGKDAEELKAAQEALAKDPKDPKANLVAGRYLCFSKGDWKKGLPLLALGSDQTLKGLAEQELGLPPTQPAEQVNLGDGWWEIASSLGRGQASTVKLHAGQWYKQGAGGLAEGLGKNKVDQRLREVAKLRTALPQPPLAIAPFDEKQAKQHQEAWAEYLRTPVEITTSLGLTLVLIPPGAFVMGEGNDAHKVTISKPFFLGKYEVTQEQWSAVMGSNPSSFKGPRNPVERVDWNDCQVFVGRLNERATAVQRNQARAARGAFGDGRGIYNLPTEAQWEYACRAGSTTRWWFGDEEARFDGYGWVLTNSENRAHPVGQKTPNPWGLHDLYGNVWEWCADWFDKDYYKTPSSVDPLGPAMGVQRADRGGAWPQNAAVWGRSAARHGRPIGNRFHDLGFRIALLLPDK